MTYGGGWDQLVAPMATCVSYAKDLAPLSYNDQARARPALGRAWRLHQVALTASPRPPSAPAPGRMQSVLFVLGQAMLGRRVERARALRSQARTDRLRGLIDWSNVAAQAAVHSPQYWPLSKRTGLTARVRIEYMTA